MLVELQVPVSAIVSYIIQVLLYNTHETIYTVVSALEMYGPISKGRCSSVVDGYFVRDEFI